MNGFWIFWVNMEAMVSSYLVLSQFLVILICNRDTGGKLHKFGAGTTINDHCFLVNIFLSEFPYFDENP